MSFTMQQLTRVLDLQQRAYETLVWLDLYSLAHPELLDDQAAAALQEPQACIEWVTRCSSLIPARWRPSKEDLDMFARLFASFFQASYAVQRLEHDGKSYYRLRPNKELMSSKERAKASRQPVKHRLRRRRNEAHALVDAAIAPLAFEAHATDDAVARVLQSAEHRGDVAIWTYACELMDRARGGPHGPAAYMLWQAMDPETRRNLSADVVWQARDRLVTALSTK